MYKKYIMLNEKEEVVDIKYVNNKVNWFVLINPLYCLEKSYLRWIPILNVSMVGMLKLFGLSMDLVPYLSSMPLIYGSMFYGRLLTNYLDRRGYTFEKNVKNKF